jgi:hypothetical protein
MSSDNNRNSDKSISCEFAFKCPLRWSQFTPTEQENVRHCSECNRNVHLALSQEELNHLAVDDQCVAVRLQASDLWVGRIHIPYGSSPENQ